MGLDGRLVLLNPPSKPGRQLLIFAVSPVCVPCNANSSRYQQAAAQAQVSGWQVAWVSRDSLEITSRYFAQFPSLSTPILSEVSHATYAQLGLAVVPTAIAVGNGGVVEGVWPDQLTEEQFGELMRFIHEHAAVGAHTSGGAASSKDRKE